MGNESSKHYFMSKLFVFNGHKLYNFFIGQDEKLWDMVENCHDIILNEHGVCVIRET